jgi:RHS repeat-associated protein
MAPNRVPLAIERPAAPIVVGSSGGGFVPNGGVGVRATPARVVRPTAAEEMLGSRTEHSKVTSNPDGTYTTAVSSGRINFKDSAGAWQPIDVSLVSDLADGYTLRTKANDRTVRIGDIAGADRLAELTAGDRTIRLRVLGTGAGSLDAAKSSVSFAAAPGTGQFSVVPTPEGLEFSVSLGHRTDASTYRVLLDTGGLTASLGPDGQTVFLSDSTGTPVGKIGAPSLIDSAGNLAPHGSITTSIVNAAVGTSLTDDGSVAPIDGATPPAPSSPPVPTAAPSVQPTASPTAAVDANAETSPPASSIPSRLLEPTASGSPGVSSEPSTSAVPSPIPPSATAQPSAAPSASTTPTTAPSAAPASAAPTVTNVVRPNELILSYAIDPAWLLDLERVFPVTLDPTACIEFNFTPTGCDLPYGAPNSNYGEGFTESNFPNDSPTGSWDRIGYQTTNGHQHAFYYFGHVGLPDGAIVTNADLRFRQQVGVSGGQQLHTTANISSWSHSTISWNSEPTIDSVWMPTVAAQTPAQCTVACYIHQDVTPIVRARYTRQPLDWKIDFGFSTRLVNDAGTTGSAAEVIVYSASYSNTSARPFLTITYFVPQVSINFDASLGADFVPTTMPAGGTVNVPVTITNNGSAQTFNAAVSSDYYKVGWRWFDATGKYATGFTASGTVNLPADIPPSGGGSTSATISLPVNAPPNPGQYGLRLDLAHVIGSTALWASDWAKPSYYYARVKDPLASSGNTRWAGSSVVKRADFPIAVVSGGGTAGGETKSVDLPDGGSLGINTWSRNLTYSGSGGVGFNDLGDDVGLTYGYNSADRLDCTGILAACGWWTNYDEGFVPGTNGADYIYHDERGNRHFINANANGQLTGAPARIDRPRYTVMDENALGSWTVATPTLVSSPLYSGTRAFQIASTGLSTASMTIKFSLDQYPLASFAATSTATGTAIGFHVTNNTTGYVNWLFYTLGTDFVTSSYPRVALGGAIGSWLQTLQRDLRQDILTKGFGGAYDAYTVDGVDFWGNQQSGKTATYDAIRFEGRASQIYSDLGGGQPAWTANGTNATANTADKVVGANSIQVADATYALSPTCNCLTGDLSAYPYVRWSWKSLGGTAIGHTFTVKDVRTLVTGSITYYAGAVAPTGAPNPIQIAGTVPDTWTSVTRNLEEDARSVLGFFNDADTGGNESAPGGGPKPDQLNMTGYVLMSAGATGLFDDESIVSLPWLGDQHGALAGDDFVVTFRGGSQHRFNRDGKLTLLEDLDNNQTKVIWTYDFTARTYALATIRAPSDGQALLSGLAQREIAVVSTATYVKFSEQLGSESSGFSGRYTELDRTIGANLTTVIPARRSAACAGSGATGCLKFTYDAGGAHRLIKIYDPRSTGADAMSHSISWTGADPMTVTADASASALLRILSWNAGSTWRTRPEYQDADGVTANYARYDDLTPNGSVLAEYVPLPCVNANCGSGTTTPAVPVNMLVVYTTDGIDNYSTEIHYRGTNLNPVTSRRGTFAAAKVDNFSDALTAGLTAWKQDPEQYTASMAATGGANPDLYRTTFAYNALGLQTHAVTPVRNPVGTNNVAAQDVATLYDAEGHLLQTADNGFLQNGGFETGLAGWTTTNASASTSGPNSGTASLALAASGSATPATTPELLPGQTLRFQAALKASAGSLHFGADYQRASDSAWLPMLASTADGSTVWHTVSYDLAIPLDGNGLVRGTFTTNAGESGNVDDVAIFTAFAARAYLSNGLVSTQSDVLGHATLSGYAAGATYPGIFPTTSTANYKSGQPATADQNVVSSATYDAWGRTLVATDPDGKATTTTYAANMTDVSSVADGLGNTTSNTLYDEIGNVRTQLDPLSQSTTTTYTFLGDPLDVTAPDGVVTHNGYDGVGHLTSITRNYVSGGVGTAGVSNVKETRAYDFLGRVTRVIGDVGVSDATSDTSYDYTGNVVNATVYPDGTANPRTTSTFFDEAGTPTGTRGPITPTGPPAPLCPGSGSFYCHRVSTVDLNGRVTATTDAYGKVATTWYDFAGHAVRQVANDTGGAQTSDTNVTSSARYDPAGHVVSATDPLGRVSSTVYDNLDRVTKVVRPDGSWQRTDYTAAGRTDQVSRPGASGQQDTDVSWTKTLYDGAGRGVRSIGNFDRTGTAGINLVSFEGDIDRWSGTASGFFTASASSSAYKAGLPWYDGVAPRTGSAMLGVHTSPSATLDGAWWDLTGTGSYGLPAQTFKAGHTYAIRFDARAESAPMTVRAFLGQDASGGSNVEVDGDGGAGGIQPLGLTTAWQSFSATWTPAADLSTNVHFAVRSDVAVSAWFYVDNVVFYDSTAGYTDRNIPSETVYDKAGQVIESVLPPGDVVTDRPMVTMTGYDTAGRSTLISVNETMSYPATVTGDDLQAYWPLDDTGGSTTDDPFHTYDLTIAGGVTRGVSGAIDDGRTAFRFDGTSGIASRTLGSLSQSTNFSLDAWIRPAGIPGGTQIAVMNGGSSDGFGIGVDASGNVIGDYKNAGVTTWLTTTANVTDGKWHYVAIVRNTTTTTMYVDGVAYTPTNSTATPGLAWNNTSIGAEYPGSRHFAGEIDEVGLYDTVESSSAIAARYAVGRSSSTTDNLTTRSSYDALGNAIDTTDPAWVISHADLDRRGNVTATTQNYVSGGSTSATQNVKSTFAYDDLDELTASCTAQRVQSDACIPTTPSTSAWRTAYDLAGHATAQIPPVNATAAALVTTTSVYDTASGGGRLTRSCDHAAGGSCATALRYTDYAYDNLGRATTTTTFQGAPTGTEKLRSVTSYNAAGERTQVDYTENAAGSPTDSLTFGHDLLGRETTVSRAGSPLTTTVYNPDGSIASRTDHVISATPSSFGYDARGNLTSATSPLFTGSAGFTWRLDGLVAGRTWPGTANAAAFAYDGAKRPTTLAETVSGSAQATFGRTYDRNGRVRSETQTLVGISGDAGAGTQSFDYDNLGRVTSSSIPGSSNNKAYTYDADSNRLTQTENGVTASFAYDRTDELTTLTIDGIVKNEVYDAYGNLTTSVTPDSKKPDTQAPTVPTGVSATAVSPTQVNLSWTASSDDRAVIRYSVYRGGSLLSVVTGALTSFTDRSTNKNTAYAYTVSSSDAAGNSSAVSSTANVTTPNGSVPTDTTAPTVPTGLSVTATSSIQLNLAWTASTDANGVQGYRVYRGGSLIATVGSTSYWDTGLTRSTAYSYTVAAIDGTGNASAQGTAAGGSTQDPPAKTTGYTYDFTDRLTSINATGIFTLSTFAFDALGRHRTKSIGGSTVATYSYAATSGAVVRIAGPSLTTDSAVDATDSRLATKTSTALFGWTLPDLHGDVAGALNSSGSTVTDAFRYDAYGETIDKVTSTLPTPWRYQGRLLENEVGDADLYDFGFRSYVADLGAFNSLDDQPGSAQNPISLNRFLYANANPATLIDPDGHCATDEDWYCGFLGGLGLSLMPSGIDFHGAANAIQPYSPMTSMAIGFTDRSGQIVHETAQGVGQTAGGVIRYHTDTLSRARTDAENVARVRGFAADPAGSIRSGLSKAAHATGSWVGHMHAELNSGDMYRVGAASADVTSVVDAAAGGVLALRAFIRRAGIGNAMEGAFRPRVTAYAHEGTDVGRRIHSRYGDDRPVFEGEQPSRISGPDPAAQGTSHTRLAWDTTNNRIYKAREYGSGGRPRRDIDFTRPTYPTGRPRPNHSVPEVHHWTPVNPHNLRAGYRRGPGSRLMF